MQIVLLYPRKTDLRTGVTKEPTSRRSGEGCRDAPSRTARAALHRSQTPRGKGGKKESIASPLQQHSLSEGPSARPINTFLADITVRVVTRTEKAPRSSSNCCKPQQASALWGKKPPQVSSIRRVLSIRVPIPQLTGISWPRSTGPGPRETGQAGEGEGTPARGHAESPSPPGGDPRRQPGHPWGRHKPYYYWAREKKKKKK